MKLSTTILAMFSSVLLLAACETAPNSNSTNGTHGGNYGGPGANGENTLDKEHNVGDRVFFDFDSSVIKTEGQDTLQKQADWLKKNASLNVTVEGHCDERGTREYNLALGERRAAAAKHYLVSLGVEAGRIQTISYGKERPAVVGSDESAWSQNRRAVTVVAN